MSLYVLVLVLIAAVLHASWNLLAKKTQGKTPFIWLQYVASNILYLPIMLIQTKFSGGYSFSDLLWFSCSSAVLHLIYFVVLQKGYRNADLSIVYPLARGSAPLVSFIAAIAFLHERFNIGSALGLLLIIAGVLVITRLRLDKQNDSLLMTGVGYGLLTGLFIALYTINDTIAIKNYHLPPLTLTLTTNFFSVILLSPFIVHQKKELKRELKTHKWIVIAVGLLSPAAYILVLQALRFAPLTVIAPARETSILLGVFMGSQVFDEKDGRRRLIASCLILAGIVALSVS